MTEAEKLLEAGRAFMQSLIDGIQGAGKQLDDPAVVHRQHQLDVWHGKTRKRR